MLTVGDSKFVNLNYIDPDHLYILMKSLNRQESINQDLVGGGKPGLQGETVVGYIVGLRCVRAWYHISSF